MTFPPRRGQHRRIIRQQLTVLRWCFYDQYVVRVAGICFKEVLHIIRQIAAHTGRFPRGTMHIREILAIPPSRQLAQRQFGVYAIQFGHIRHVCGISFQKFSQVTADVGPHKIGGLVFGAYPLYPLARLTEHKLKRLGAWCLGALVVFGSLLGLRLRPAGRGHLLELLVAQL